MWLCPRQRCRLTLATHRALGRRAFGTLPRPILQLPRHLTSAKDAVAAPPPRHTALRPPSGTYDATTKRLSSTRAPVKGKGRKQNPRAQYGSILSLRPGEEINTDILLSKIRPSRLKIHPKNGGGPLMILLVTPTLSKQLLHDDSFIQRALNSAYPASSISQAGRFHTNVLVAVVDRLPTPSLSDGDRFEGFEGIAYAYMPASCLSEYSCQESHDQNTDISSQDTYTLSIRLETKASDLGSIRQYDVKIPLANTVFQTGLPATFFWERWVRRRDASAFDKLGRAPYKHATIQWPRLTISLSKPESSRDFVPDIFKLAETRLAAPLLPLTPPRQIHSGMGNIIRQTIDADGNVVPASQELERVILQYFQQLEQPQTSIPVWALVLPPAAVESMRQRLGQLAMLDGGEISGSTTWTSTTFQDLVYDAIRNGGRLHRVQSGGGGWGKKAGLLSLDPTTYHQDAVAKSADDSLNDSDLSAFLSSQLGVNLEEIAKPGDFLQLFVVPINLDDFEFQTPSFDTSGPHDASVEFGTVPSTVDTMPGAAAEAKDTDKSIFVFDDHFGALSEVGIGIQGSSVVADGKSEVHSSKSELNHKGETDNTIRTKVTDVDDAEHSTNKSTHTIVPFMRTTIDIPYSRFSLYNFSVPVLNLPTDSKHESTANPPQKNIMDQASIDKARSWLRHSHPGQQKKGSRPPVDDKEEMLKQSQFVKRGVRKIVYSPKPQDEDSKHARAMTERNPRDTAPLVRRVHATLRNDDRRLLQEAEQAWEQVMAREGETNSSSKATSSEDSTGFEGTGEKSGTSRQPSRSSMMANRIDNLLKGF